MTTEYRKLTAIMFTDIAGYTALMSKDERKALSVLAKNRALQKRLAKKHRGEFIKEMGDGTLLCFNSTLDALRCAEAIQAAVKDDPDVNYRIGIHTGDIVFKDGDVFGDGVNIASRIEPLASPGGICFSGEVYHSIRNQTEIIKAIPMGQRRLKNVAQPVEIFALAGKEWSRSRIKREKIKHKIAASRRLYYVFSTVVMMGVLFIIFRENILFSRPAPSVGVLYMKNIGEAENEFFSYGVTEDIIIDLSKAGMIYVPSVNDVIALKDSDKPLIDIAESLGVRYILTGSILKDTEGVRLAMQLVEPGRNKTLWSDRWQTPLEEIPSIKGRIISEVIQAIDLHPSKAASSQYSSAASPNPNAYEFYLKGRFRHQHAKTYEDVTVARGMYQKAVEIDSVFIAPLITLGETFSLTGEYDKALSYFQTALSSSIRLNQPVQEAVVRTDIGGILRIQGQYEKAVEQFETSLSISKEINDKQSIGAVLHELGILYDETSEWDKALENFNAALKIAREIDSPRMEYVNLNSIGVIYNNHGDREKALDYFTQSLNLRLEFDDQRGAALTLYNIGTLQDAGADYSGALSSFSRALKIFEDLRDKSSIGYVLDGLGGVQYSLGNLDTSKSLRKRSLAILTEIGDSSAVGYVSRSLGSIYTAQGKFDSAMTYLERSLAIFTAANDRRMTANTYTNMGHIFFLQDKQTQTVSYLEKAVAILDTLEANIEILEPYSLLLLSKQMAGDTAYVADRLPLLEKRLESIDNTYLSPSFLLHMIKIASLRGDERAEKDYIEAAYKKVESILKNKKAKDTESAETLGPVFQEIIDLWKTK